LIYSFNVNLRGEEKKVTLTLTGSVQNKRLPLTVWREKRWLLYV